MIIVNKQSVGFGPLIRQNKQFECVILSSWKLQWAFFFILQLSDILDIIYYSIISFLCSVQGVLCACTVSVQMSMFACHLMWHVLRLMVIEHCKYFSWAHFFISCHVWLGMQLMTSTLINLLIHPIKFLKFCSFCQIKKNKFQSTGI